MFFFVRSKVKSFYLLPDEITTGSIHKYFVYIIYILRLYSILKEQKKKNNKTTNDSQEMGSRRFKSWLKLWKKKANHHKFSTVFKGSF